MPAAQSKLLVVDDDPTFRDVLEMRLEEWGYQVRVADHARKAADIIRSWKPDLILSDVVMPEVSGLQLLAQLRVGDPHRPVVLLTAHGTVEMAVEAMKLGAVDFVSKPVNYGNLRAVLRETLRERARGLDTAAQPPVGSTVTPEAARGGSTPFVGESPAIVEAYELITSVADSDASVLITGESGTGKELAARAIHDRSNRREHPFIAVNAAAIPRELVESEIFGHERGAFTGATEARPGCFELADRGTLFLDEIGEMPRELQPKLLRVLDQASIRRLGGQHEYSFDVRTLAATNRDPRAAVAEGVLREDLFFRLNVLQVHLPPLRERNGDIPILARHFAEELSLKHGGPPREFDDEALDIMRTYHWPGNIRELRNLVERAVVLARDHRIHAALLPPYVREPDSLGNADYAFPPGATAAEVERALIVRTLHETGNNKSETARRLGLSVKTIRSKLKSYGIDG